MACQPSKDYFHCYHYPCARVFRVSQRIYSSQLGVNLFGAILSIKLFVFYWRLSLVTPWQYLWSSEFDTMLTGVSREDKFKV